MKTLLSYYKVYLWSLFRLANIGINYIILVIDYSLIFYDFSCAYHTKNKTESKMK